MGIFKKEDKIKEEAPLPPYYDSINIMPMIVWNKIHKDFNFSHLLINPREVTEREMERLGEIWVKIYDEFISHFGFSEHLQDIISLESKIARLTLKMVSNDDMSIKNFISAHERQLKVLKEKIGTSEGDVYTAKQNIELFFNIPLSMVTCPVREFYSYSQQIKKENGRKPA